MNTAHEPASSFTTSPRSTTRSLYVCNSCSNSEFLRCTSPQALQNELSFPHVVPSRLLTFVTCPAGNFFELSHSLSSAAFASGILIAWNRRVHKIAMTQRIDPTFSNKIFMVSGLSLSNALSRGLRRHMRVLSSESRVSCSSFRRAL